MTSTQPTVLLTTADVDRWREELRLAKQIVDEQNKKIALLTRRIDSAQLFVSEAVAAKVTSTKPAPLPEDTSGISMFDAIRRVIQATGRPLEPREIASAIKTDAAMPDKIRNSHPNYLYTALKRMSDKKKLTRDSKGRYSIAQTNEAA